MLHVEVFSSDNLSVSDKEHLHYYGIVSSCKCYDIPVVSSKIRDLLFFRYSPDTFDKVPVFSGTLIVHRIGALLHPACQLSYDIRVITG